MRTPLIARVLLLAASLSLSLAACSDTDAPAPVQTGAADTADAADAGTSISTTRAPADTAAANGTAVATTPVPEHLREGQQLYQYWCSACHARGPGHPGTQALEARYAGAMPGTLEDRTNLTPEFVAVFVRNGISIMPFFRKTEINDEELAAIGAYLAYTPPEQAPQAP